jgi:choline-sulfatase
MKNKKSSPNVLLITMDQWPGSFLGCDGHSVIETPTLDRLARNGVRFTRAYSECPICIPARRTLMTGQTPKLHGDRIFQKNLRMPSNTKTIAQTFRDAGYQAFAVGKLHVMPQRDRIGFDDAYISEEGRPYYGSIDDYDLFLAEKGHVGQQFSHGVSNNDYTWRTWQLPEDCHVTNWATQQMCRTIKRRNPDKPGFWYLSFTHPHPPLVPLHTYFDRYTRKTIPKPLVSNWSEKTLSHFLKNIKDRWPQMSPEMIDDVRRAFYALCTHIDAQIRIVIGTLREEKLLDNTIIMITSDHGDMLGDFGLFAKRVMYENSTRIPMVVLGTKENKKINKGSISNRLVGLADVMPTLLDLANIKIPSSCNGQSMFDSQPRKNLYAEANEGINATRMITDDRYKLVWYPHGNIFQLFDLKNDPEELIDVSLKSDFQNQLNKLKTILADNLYGDDLAFLNKKDLVGIPTNISNEGKPSLGLLGERELLGQRGMHYPPPPISE